MRVVVMACCSSSMITLAWRWLSILRRAKRWLSQPSLSLVGACTGFHVVHTTSEVTVRWEYWSWRAAAAAWSLLHDDDFRFFVVQRDGYLSHLSLLVGACTGFQVVHTTSESPVRWEYWSWGAAAAAWSLLHDDYFRFFVVQRYGYLSHLSLLVGACIGFHVVHTTSESPERREFSVGLKEPDL